MKFRRLFAYFATSAFLSSAMAQDDRATEAVNIVMTLCLAGGRTDEIQSDPQNQLRIGTAAHNVTLEHHEFIGVIGGLQKEMGEVQSNQISSARDCTKQYIGQIMELFLHPPTAAPDLAQPEPIFAPTQYPSLLSPADATNFANEAVNYGRVPTVGLNPIVADYTPIYINGGAVITSGELWRAMSSGAAFALVDVWDSDHAPLPRAAQLPGAGTIDPQNDAAKQNWFVSSLLAITGNSYDLPVVIYCQGVRCWESFNAATRAIAAGFRNVYWYRGGVWAWAAFTQAANAPVAAPEWCRVTNKNMAEAAICASADLWRMDAVLVQRFDALLARVSTYDQDRYRNDEARWLGVRNACGGNIACLETVYQRRIAYLNGL